jgi:cell division protein FtsI (penicillin-binding protein 3)
MLIQFENRFKKFIIIIIILFLITIFRNIYILIKYDYLKNESINFTDSIKRGSIYDRNGNLIAGIYKYKSVFIDPFNINQNELDRLLSILEETLSINKNELKNEILTKKKSRFLWVKRFISEDEYNKLKDKKTKNIFFKDEYKRYYINGKIYSNFLGFCNNYLKGIEGLEYQFDKILYNSENNIYLTIDSNIQLIVYNILNEHFLKETPLWCSAIIQDATNGDILSFVKFPSYDPELYYLYEQSTIKNNPLSDSFEPGSAFKVFTFSCLKELNKLDLNFHDYCNGYYELTKNIKIQDLKPHGYIDIIKTFKYSCNYGTIKLAENLSKTEFFQFLQSLNFGALTGIELPGESKGILKTPKEWTKMSKAIINIGQEITVNAIQMISAFSSIINGGNYYQPKIINKIDYEGGGKKNNTPIVLHNPISKETSNFILNLLKEGISDDSTGKEANPKIETVLVGGKTGTAQIPNPKGGYYKDKNLASFIGYFIYKNKIYSIYIVFYDPKTNVYGGQVAAPIFKEIVLKLKNYFDINSNILILKDFKIDDKTISELINNNYIKLNNIYKNSNGKLPSFIGLNLKEAIYLANLLKIKLKIYGSGYVYFQDIEPGKNLSEIKVLTLKLKEE